jgi:hypothetical protein
MPVISALGRLIQEDHKFEVSLDYITISISKKEKKKQPISLHCFRIT